MPVVKNYEWLELARKQASQAIAQANVPMSFEYVYEPLNTELLVAYAVDTPSNVLYLSQEQFEKRSRVRLR